MRDLVEYVVKQLVTNPDAVLVEETNGPDGVNLLLTVDPLDMGIVIGKAGQTIKSIRKLILVKAINDGVRVNLALNDQNPEGQMSEAPSAAEVKSEEIGESEDSKAEGQSEYVILGSDTTPESNEAKSQDDKQDAEKSED